MNVLPYAIAKTCSSISITPTTDSCGSQILTGALKGIAQRFYIIGLSVELVAGYVVRIPGEASSSQRFAGGGNQGITCFVPHVVIDELEAVQVDRCNVPFRLSCQPGLV